MIDIILDTFIPGDNDLGMPPASTLDFSQYCTKTGIHYDVQKYLDVIIQISMDKYNCKFEDLTCQERLIVIKETKITYLRLFTQFLSHCFRAYYSNPMILKRLNVGSVPPFPNGNMIQSENWDILEPVYERGIAYRSVNKK